MTAFYVLGGVLAAWALIVTALGLTRHGFPGEGAGERIVAAISVVLVAGAIGSGIITAANNDHGGEEHAEASEAAGGEEQAESPEAAGGEGGEPPEGALQVTADPSGALSFDTDSLQAEAGEVTIVMENPSPVPHNVAIEGDGVAEESETVAEASSEVSAELEPGEYTFFCSVEGHREGGMEGTLTVE